MKLGCQNGMAPGKEWEAQFQNIRSYGFDGVEVWGQGILENLEQLKAASRNAGLPICTICAGYQQTLLHTDPKQRGIALSQCKELLTAATEVGALGLVMVPIFGPPQINDLSPLATAEQLELRLFEKQLRSLARHGEKVGAVVLVEPLNRYETHLLNRLEQACTLCDKVDSPASKVMGDFFHMGIEEKDTAASIRAARPHLRHIHLADNTRKLPGQGSRDFRPGFAALQAIGYRDFMVVESGIEGDPKKELPKCARFLRRIIEQGKE